jgi:hypothetical protein
MKGHSSELGIWSPNISAKRLIARITRQLTTAAQAAALPLNSTLYHPRAELAIAAIKTRIVFRSTVMNGHSSSSPLTMLHPGPFDYARKIQTEATGRRAGTP